MVVGRSSIVSQVRYISTTKPCLRIKRRETIDKVRLLKEAKEFFGPTNITGEHYKNKYYYPNQKNRPNYVVKDGSPLVGAEYENRRPSRFSENKQRNPREHPFPNNLHTRTAYLIPDELKEKIIEDSVDEGLHAQEIAHKYSINLLRVEAILKLHQIEQEFKPETSIAADLKQYSTVMKRMFPLFSGGYSADNLTEIPTPHKTLHDRFLTIEESEPFGPVDAARILQLEPAEDTLKKLTEFNIEDIAKQREAEDKKKVNVVYGKQREGENKVFKFIQRDSGTFGHRYGASRRDKKKDRAIGFDASGKMIYLHPNEERI
ncbi:MRPS35 37S ribosomal protein S35 [Candida maltosa Xu316]